MQADLIKQKIIAALGEAEVSLSSFDGVHYDAHVRSPAFAGKSRLEQHRMVMNALRDELGANEVHALALKTEVLEK
ncbi:MAG: BolA family protein [Cardiobacteriaceae bacterium]|nr:BolA family protein [Cardiobacteriaceae bacterium]